MAGGSWDQALYLATHRNFRGPPGRHPGLVVVIAVVIAVVFPPKKTLIVPADLSAHSLKRAFTPSLVQSSIPFRLCGHGGNLGCSQSKTGSGAGVGGAGVGGAGVGAGVGGAGVGAGVGGAGVGGAGGGRGFRDFVFCFFSSRRVLLLFVLSLLFLLFLLLPEGIIKLATATKDTTSTRKVFAFFLLSIV